jgi:hypothetical protein
MSFNPFSLLLGPVINTVEMVIDNVILDSVYPKRGSIVYCDLAFGYAEHSGIYIGDGKIVHLNGNGLVKVVSPKQFIEGKSAISIYVSCDSDACSVGSNRAANRAEAWLDHQRDYNVILDNCHQFTSACLTGDLENCDNFMRMLKWTAEEKIGAKKWRLWQLSHDELF